MKKDKDNLGRIQQVQRQDCMEECGRGKYGVFHGAQRMGREQATKVTQNMNISKHELYPEGSVCVSGDRHQRVLTRGVVDRFLPRGDPPGYFFSGDWESWGKRGFGANSKNAVSSWCPEHHGCRLLQAYTIHSISSFPFVKQPREMAHSWREVGA